MKIPTLFATLSLLILPCSLGYEWNDIPEEERSATKCRSESDAAAEVLYHERLIDQSDYRNRFEKNIIRIKVYKESALPIVQNHKIRYWSYQRIGKINARVVKPNGESIEIDEDAIFKTKKVSGDDYDLFESAFAYKQVEVGDIVELHFTLVTDIEGLIGQFFSIIQSEWPTRVFKFTIWPNKEAGYSYRWFSNNCSKTLERHKDGSYKMKMEDVPSFPDEPNQQSRARGAAWVAFSYVRGQASDEAFWIKAAKELYRETETRTKPDAAIRARAKELTNGIKNPEAKLAALYDFCRTDLINTDYDIHGEIDADQENKLKKETHASKILQLGYGLPENIDTTFCSLARAAGFDARLARSNGRTGYPFSKKSSDVNISLPYELVAVKLDSKWTFFDAASKYLEFGKLDWRQDQVRALIGDKKEALITTTQKMDTAHNLTHSIGQFEITEDGSLKGKVQVSRKGYAYYWLKNTLCEKGNSERQEKITELLRDIWPNVEVSRIRFNKFTDPRKPLIVAFDVLIPNFATLSGDRMLLQPSVFHLHDEHKLTAAERKTKLFFRGFYRSIEDVSIKLPDGYTLDQANAPRPFEIKNFISYNPKLSFSREHNTLVFKRVYDFRGRLYEASAYKAIKGGFDMLQQADSVTVSIVKTKENTVSMAL